MLKKYVDGVVSGSTNVSSSCIWSVTSGSSYVSVNGSGLVTGRGNGAGSATATASYTQDGKTYTDSESVSVYYESYSLEVSPSHEQINVGETTGKTAMLTTYRNGSYYSEQYVTSLATWKSSNTSVATISGGTIKGVGPGPATITATYKGASDSGTITVAGSTADEPVVDQIAVYQDYSGDTYSVHIDITMSDGTKYTDVGYNWRCTYAQNSSIMSTGTSGGGPLTFKISGTTYSFSFVLTTTSQYRDANGNVRPHTTSTSVSASSF